MRILSVDSSLGSQVAVIDLDSSLGQPRVVASYAQPSPRAHAESLGPMLAQALQDGDHQVDAVVAATGPAPFTGLRAGLVTARVLARSRGCALYGVPSLDAVARRAFDDLGTPELSASHEDAAASCEATVLVLTDARRKEVYAAAYRARGTADVQRMSDYQVLSQDDARALVANLLAGQAGAGLWVAGSGAHLYPHIWEGQGARGLLADASGDAITQVRLALARSERGEELDTEPLYLRHADIHGIPAGQ